MEQFKKKIMRFMYGRYGMDQLSKFIIYLSMVLLIITFIFKNIFLYTIIFLVVMWTYYRFFSKNISKRYSENQIYLNCKYKILKEINFWKIRIKESKVSKIYRCPSCGQKIRVPKGKGKISIKCPKCRIEFIKKT